MRLKQSSLKNYYAKRRRIKKDNEGGTYVEYGAAFPFPGIEWPASGKVQAEMYGNRLSYIRNVKIDGVYTVKADDRGNIDYVFENGLVIREMDGLCIYVKPDDAPDYKIISIKPYMPLRLECECL